MLPSVVILCGGRGTRLQEHVPSIPKPLVEIGGHPILWHVIHIYLAQGFTEFVLLTGHKAKLIEDFVAATPWPENARVRCIDTGTETPTGGRIALAADAIDGPRFCATYADGVADIDLSALLSEHAEGGITATMTVVQPELPFGVAELNGDGRVRGFAEKPRSERWINGGFFCFERRVLELLEPESVLEREPLAGLAERGELRAFRHRGFWECLDTYKSA